MSDLFAHLLSPKPEKDKAEAKDEKTLPEKEAERTEAVENNPPETEDTSITLVSVTDEAPLTDDERLYYSIGEVAERFKVAPSLLRFWEKEFEQLKPRKNAKGTRFYTRENIEVISLIYHLVKEKGYTLQGAREKMKASRKVTDSNIEVVNTLKNIRALLLEIKAELDQES